MLLDFEYNVLNFKFYFFNFEFYFSDVKFDCFDVKIDYSNLSSTIYRKILLPDTLRIQRIEI